MHHAPFLSLSFLFPFSLSFACRCRCRYQTRTLLEEGELCSKCPLGDTAEEPVGLLPFNARPLPIKDGSGVDLEATETIACKVSGS